MAQELSLVEALHKKTAALFHRFHAMTEDDVICELEQEETLDTLDALTELANLAMASQAAGITMMRRGPESARVKRQVRAIEARHGDAA